MCSLAEWPSSSVCSFVVIGNPAFSLGEQLSSPKGGGIIVESCILIG